MGGWKAEFTKLKAWRMAFEVTIDVYRLTKAFPSDERFGLISQMRRAGTSIPSSIAEGFARRRPKDEAYYYTVAHASGEELKSELLVARRLGYVAEAPFDDLMTRLDEIGRMVHGMIESMEARVSSS